jgi:hypothetical protein
MSLNNLGIRLSDLGRREEALAATQEAVNISATARGHAELEPTFREVPRFPHRHQLQACYRHSQQAAFHLD